MQVTTGFGLGHFHWRNPMKVERLQKYPQSNELPH
jgi:hypothetical protein